MDKEYNEFNEMQESRGGNFRQILWMQIFFNIDLENWDIFVKAFIAVNRKK